MGILTEAAIESEYRYLEFIIQNNYPVILKFDNGQFILELPAKNITVTDVSLEIAFFKAKQAVISWNESQPKTEG
jgi:hypothetical protein